MGSQEREFGILCIPEPQSPTVCSCGWSEEGRGQDTENWPNRNFDIVKLRQGDALKDANLFAGPSTAVLFGAGGGWGGW